MIIISKQKKKPIQLSNHDDDLFLLERENSIAVVFFSFSRR